MKVGDLVHYPVYPDLGIGLVTSVATETDYVVVVWCKPGDSYTTNEVAYALKVIK
jgi:hypothetical protein